MNTGLRTISSIWLALILLVNGGCCRSILSDPPRPTSLQGWRTFKKDNGVTAIGEFVLTKGQSVDNGNFGVELLDVVPSRVCRGTESAPAQAIVRFYRVANRQVLAELTIGDGNGASLINFNSSLVDEYSVSTISIAKINTKENWILFTLSK